MSTSGFTLEALQILEESIAEGVLKVKYTDKEVEYRSLTDMIKTRNLMRKCLGLDKCSDASSTGLFGGRRINMEHSKGLC